MRRAIAKLNEYSAPLIEALTREARVHIQYFSQQVCQDVRVSTRFCSTLYHSLAHTCVHCAGMQLYTHKSR